MKSTIGDFNYNGIPMFNVGLSDFHLFIESLNDNKKILSKHIMREDLQLFYKSSRNTFGICYEGVMIDYNLNRIAKK